MSDPTPPQDAPSAGALPPSLLARIHLYLGLQALTLPWDQAESHLLAWLDALPDAAHGDGLRLGVALCVEQQSIRWSADGPVGLMIHPVAQHFQRRSVAPEQQSLLATAGPLLRPDRLGFWVEVEQERPRLGWSLPASRRLADVVGWSPEPKAAAPVLEWAEASGVLEAHGLSRSLDADAPFVELLLRAPGADGAARLEAVERLCAALKLPAPLAGETLAQAPALELVVRLGSRGAEDLGVRVPSPGPLALGALCGAVRQAPSAALGPFARALGAGEPAWAELRVGREGQRVELGFTPGSAPSAEAHAAAVAKAEDLMRMES